MGVTRAAAPTPGHDRRGAGEDLRRSRRLSRLLAAPAEDEEVLAREPDLRIEDLAAAGGEGVLASPQFMRTRQVPDVCRGCPAAAPAVGSSEVGWSEPIGARAVADPISLTHRILARSRSAAPMRASLVIPALNEAAVIGDVVAAVPTGLVVEIVAVDNGSTDGTEEVAARAGARVVREPRRGYGAACAAGVGGLDGDGSQDPRELRRLLGPLERGEADFVLGARPIGRHHPLHASLGSGLVARLVWFRYGVRLTDIGPFRALPVALLRRLGMRDLAFGWPRWW